MFNVNSLLYYNQTATNNLQTGLLVIRIIRNKAIQNELDHFGPLFDQVNEINRKKRREAVLFAGAFG